LKLDIAPIWFQKQAPTNENILCNYCVAMRPIIEITIFKKNKYHLQTDTPRMMKMPKAAKPKYTKLPECTKQLSIHNLVLLLMEKEIREQDKEKEKEFNLPRVSEHLRLLEVR